MRIIKILFLFLFLCSINDVIAQCTVEVNSGGFEYEVDVSINVIDVIYSQEGSTCNVNIELAYDIEIEVINQPGWWNESLYVLQGSFDCIDAAGTSFFDLPNSGGSGISTSKTFSFNSTDCGEVVLDCPIFLELSGPQLNTTVDCGGYIASVLPIVMNNFYESEIDENFSRLEWSTESEINFSHFDLEVSDDLIDWVEIEEIEGENRVDGAEYSYVLELSNQTKYIRLKMVDIDGKFDYSSVLFLDEKVNNYVSVYPNPASGRLYVSGLSTNAIVVYDNFGKQFALSMNENSIDISGLPNGHYVLKTISDSENSFIRFVKI